MIMDGTWRSLVARFLGVEEVAGSNPVVPIKLNKNIDSSFWPWSLVLFPGPYFLCRKYL